MEHCCTSNVYMNKKIVEHLHFDSMSMTIPVHLSLVKLSSPFYTHGLAVAH